MRVLISKELYEYTAVATAAVTAAAAKRDNNLVFKKILF